MSAKPLAGLRVLDLTRVLAGPYCTALLADLGAEVIKLEPPQGDDYRHIGPFRHGESALFQLVNRGKQSIALNLKDADALALAQQIAGTCDVVVENFRPGVAEKIGLGPVALRGADPALIYCSISGFGQHSPLRDAPAYDLVVQAMSGLMAVTGEDGGAPLKTGESFGDLLAGLFGSWAILAALIGRQKTGQGSTIDVSMFDTLFSMLPTSHALSLFAGQTPSRVGNRHPLSTPFGCYDTSDGQVAIAVLTPGQFARFAVLIGQPGLEKEARFASDSARTENEPELKRLIQHWSQGLTTEQAVSALSEANIPTAPIWDIEKAAASDHARHRGLISELQHPKIGPVPVVGQPVRFDGVKPIAETPAPALDGDANLIRAAMEAWNA